MSINTDLYDKLKRSTIPDITGIIDELIDTYSNDESVDSIISKGTGGVWEIQPVYLMQVVSGYYSNREKDIILEYMNGLINSYTDNLKSAPDNFKKFYEISITRTKLVLDIIEICFEINSKGRLKSPNLVPNKSGLSNDVASDRIVLSNACYILSAIAFGG